MPRTWNCVYIYIYICIIHIITHTYIHASIHIWYWRWLKPPTFWAIGNKHHGEKRGDQHWLRQGPLAKWYRSLDHRTRQPWHGKLVGGWSTPLKNMKVSWDDDIPNIWKNIKCSKPPTRYGGIRLAGVVEKRQECLTTDMFCTSMCLPATWKCNPRKIGLRTMLFWLYNVGPVGMKRFGVHRFFQFHSLVLVISA